MQNFLPYTYTYILPKTLYISTANSGCRTATSGASSALIFGLKRKSDDTCCALGPSLVKRTISPALAVITKRLRRQLVHERARADNYELFVLRSRRLLITARGAFAGVVRQRLPAKTVNR